jgi:hypothetical protein
MAHLHEEVEERHVHAAEKVVDLTMSCFIEVAVIPQSLSTLAREAVVRKFRGHTFQGPGNINDKKRCCTFLTVNLDRNKGAS